MKRHSRTCFNLYQVALFGIMREKGLKDVDEPSKGKLNYSRKGMPGKCLNCGESGHFKNKCPQPPKPKETTTSTQTWARGRKRGVRIE
ncbi:ATP-dependent RNA helicase glh-1 [Bienertia sinuspersici]